MIGICDDSTEACRILREKLLNSPFAEENPEILEYHNTNELSKDKRAQNLEILFLDIEMPGISGIDFMLKYHEFYRDTRIILLTAYEKYLYEGYKVPAYRYIKKPITNQQLIDLYHSIEHDQILRQRIPIRSEGVTASVKVGDIMYVQVSNNYSYIVTTRKTLSSYLSLKTLISMLPKEYFIQPNQSFLVNMKYIRDLIRKHNKIIMSDDYSIYISQRNVKQTVKSFTDFVLQ